jgi:hypothetical protein
MAVEWNRGDLMSLIRPSLVVLLAATWALASVARAEDEALAKATPVELQTLKQLLPAETAGIKQTRADAQRTPDGDAKISTATGDYDAPVPDDGAKDKPAKPPQKPRKAGAPDDVAVGDEGDVGSGEADHPHVTVKIQDYAGTTGLADAAAGWAKLDVDQETDEGYTKTRKVDGYPAYETFQKDTESGSLQVYVAGRYIVSVNTENIDLDTFQKIADALPLKKLAETK